MLALFGDQRPHGVHAATVTIAGTLGEPGFEPDTIYRSAEGVGSSSRERPGIDSPNQAENVNVHVSQSERLNKRCDQFSTAHLWQPRSVAFSPVKVAIFSTKYVPPVHGPNVRIRAVAGAPDHPNRTG